MLFFMVGVCFLMRSGKSVLTKIALSQHPKVVIYKGFSQRLNLFFMSDVNKKPTILVGLAFPGAIIIV
ncbi:hypothetical protein IW01_10800 [Pectobacterium brasiliense]|nr:hypothetical protein IW01_10800 [Pectobacterium brasiliense]